MQNTALKIGLIFFGMESAKKTQLMELWFVSFIELEIIYLIDIYETRLRILTWSRQKRVFLDFVKSRGHVCLQKEGLHHDVIHGMNQRAYTTVWQTCWSFIVVSSQLYFCSTELI